jgi:CHAT domain-containing protein
MADLARAIEAYEGACQKGVDTALEEALRAARNWGNWASARGEWCEARRAYDYGLEASERLFRTQLLRASKEAWLREARGLHARAAYALARMEEPKLAVETMERGRARLLSQILEREPADLVQLEAQAPSLYSDYVAVVNRVRFLEAQELSKQPTLPSDQPLSEAFRQAYAELEAAVNAVRQLSGFHDFLEAPTFDQIQEAAVDAPLVYLAATPMGGLALVVPPQTSDASSNVFSVWLDDLTEEALREQLQAWFGAYNAYRRALSAYAQVKTEVEEQGLPEEEREERVHDAKEGVGTARGAWLKFIDQTPRWLWRAAMGPVMAALNFCPGKGITHATLIPFGLLGVLPLHAAWAEDATKPNGRRYALDDICFITTPNARALVTARGQAVQRDAEGLLAVDEPQPVSATPLPSSGWEVAAACGHFPAQATRVLGGEAAARQAVLGALPNYPVLHFSCHGFANPAEPLESGLLMAHDEVLALRDAQGLRLARARLAVLSACETRLPGADLPDEVVSLPTGLVQAGVPGVVGSLWSVLDLSTAMLMVRFYDLWRRDGLPPMEALRRAQIWLRDTTNAEKAAYFGTELPELNATKMPLPLADALFKEAALLEPDERSFAHPFHWAAFAFTGA